MRLGHLSERKMMLTGLLCRWSVAPGRYRGRVMLWWQTLLWGRWGFQIYVEDPYRPFWCRHGEDSAPEEERGVCREGAASLCHVSKGVEESAVAWTHEEDMSPLGLQVSED